MELKDFVAETLTQIVDGIKKAQENVKDKNTSINPSGIDTEHKVFTVSSGATSPTKMIQMVNFDVSLTASQEGEAVGGVGVFFGSVGIGSQAKYDIGNISLNRVSFSVPIAFPSDSPG